MRYSHLFLEKIRNTVKTSEFISKYVKLHRKNKDFFGICPFHHEKTPSFSVNDQKKFYHCFGCGVHGDVIKFMQQIKGISFYEAVQNIAEEYGIVIPQEDKKQDDSENKILSINKIAIRWFQKNLYSEKATDVLSYLYKRSIDDTLIKNFAIGYAPNYKNNLIQHLKSHNFSINDIKNAGLITQLDDGSLIDKFRSRIIFPIINKNDRIIAFGGRSILGYHPKYINSPETALFKKSCILYGEKQFFSYHKSNKYNNIYIVEGYTDLIAMHRLGVRNVLATLGTAISEYNIKKLWELVPIPTICMDGDLAGMKSMERVANTVLPILSSGFSIDFVQFPEGQDPDDIANNATPEYLNKLLNNKISLCDFLWKIELGKVDLTIPEKQALLRKNLMELVGKINDYHVKCSYKQLFYKKLSELFRSNISNKSRNYCKSTLHKGSNILKIDRVPDLERIKLNLAAIMIKMPLLLKNELIFEDFISIEANSQYFHKLQNCILDIFSELKNCDSSETFDSSFKNALNDKISNSTLEYLCGNNSYFVNQINVENYSDMVVLWKKAFDYYNLEQLKHEYKECLTRQEKTGKDIEFALELKKEIKAKLEYLHRTYNN